MLSSSLEWLSSRLDAVRDQLASHGISRRSTRAKLRIAFDVVDARAYATEGTIYVAWWWLAWAWALCENEDTERLLRHEMAHVLGWRYPRVLSAFGIPEYPAGWVIESRRVLHMLGVLPSYGDVHPEEALAERVADLHPATLRKVARALRR